MQVANLSNALVPLNVTDSETGRPHEVFIQPFGRVRLAPNHSVASAVQLAHAGVLIFKEDDPVSPAKD